eukprot:11264508-Alexandrium_andersonii.AAC.1
MARRAARRVDGQLRARRSAREAPLHLMSLFRLRWALLSKVALGATHCAGRLVVCRMRSAISTVVLAVFSLAPCLLYTSPSPRD